MTWNAGKFFFNKHLVAYDIEFEDRLPEETITLRKTGRGQWSLMVSRYVESKHEELGDFEGTYYQAQKWAIGLLNARIERGIC